MFFVECGPRLLSRYSNWLRAGRAKDRIPVGARFSSPVQTGPGAHQASFTMGTRSFPGVKSGQGVTLTPHPLPVPRSRKGRAIPLLPLWVVRPVQSLSACTMVHFIFTFLRWVVSDTSKFCSHQKTAETFDITKQHGVTSRNA